MCLGNLSPSTVQVVDGDTIRTNGFVYRLVGFDTPETIDAKCPQERALGDGATERLRQIVSRNLIELTEIQCSCPQELRALASAIMVAAAGCSKQTARTSGKCLYAKGSPILMFAEVMGARNESRGARSEVMTDQQRGCIHCWLTNKIKAPALINAAIRIPPTSETTHCRVGLTPFRRSTFLRRSETQPEKQVAHRGQPLIGAALLCLRVW
jgi:hypothetical protein